MRAPLDDRLLAFSRSLPVDRALFPYDVAASRAHVAGLAAQGIIEPDEAKALDDALAAMRPPPEDAPDEDVHSYLERALVERLGPGGRRVHAGRSRNDQVATATRLWARDACRALALGVAELQDALVQSARAHPDAVLPGYTHLQRAQAVALGHHLAAHAWALERDVTRLRQADEAADVSPLGAGALAGSTLPLDPDGTAAALGFSRRFRSSLDAVADRDFAADLLYAAAMAFVHLSRLAEEIIVFATREFGFVTLDDTVAQGSSMLPHKHNPQVAEHLRGRAGVAIGRLTSFLAVLKGLPLAYDSDLQEDKELVFTQVDALSGALEAAALLVGGLSFDEERMAAAASDGACTAADAVEAMVAAGTPFREAYDAVAATFADGQPLDLPSPEESVAAHDGPGATSARRVAEQLDELDGRIAATRAWACA
jgi:argininosuccinate lyase